MNYEKITPDGRLWSVIYPDECACALNNVFDNWGDPAWLEAFFLTNIDDLTSFFKITDVNQAIFDTLADREILQCLILDLSPEADLDRIFRPLENSRCQEIVLGREKAKLKQRPRHSSWLRLYAIKLEPGIFVITGGAIKLTQTMQERSHTLHELEKMEEVRNDLIANDVIDKDSFVEFISEL